VEASAPTETEGVVRHCRYCGSRIQHTFVDLGVTPLANSYLSVDQFMAGRERQFPLRVRVCSSCLLVQADDAVGPESIFSDYAYFSSYSDSWVEHAKRFQQAVTERFALGPQSLVVEVASNDGYLLQHFRAADIPVQGVDPAENIARVAIARGIPTEVAFFGSALGQRLKDRGQSADLIVANNVLAHVPDIRDFVQGFQTLLKPSGVATFEFPHILRLINDLQFDTIYHEHFSYLSLGAVERVMREAGLRVFDLEEIPTHGGSLRLYACLADAPHQSTGRVEAVRRAERQANLDNVSGYMKFGPRVAEAKVSFQLFLSEAKAANATVAAFGAAAKGNTFLNVCGVTSKDIVCCFDRSPAKQGKLLPGSHIPIFPPERLADLKPDYLVILPWNIAPEIMAKNPMDDWGGKFIVAIPYTRTVSLGDRMS
jgi:SAM-dependent methyltransferase